MRSQLVHTVNWGRKGEREKGGRRERWRYKEGKEEGGTKGKVEREGGGRNKGREEREEGIIHQQTHITLVGTLLTVTSWPLPCWELCSPDRRAPLGNFQVLLSPHHDSLSCSSRTPPWARAGQRMTQGQSQVWGPETLYQWSLHSQGTCISAQNRENCQPLLHHNQYSGFVMREKKSVNFSFLWQFMKYYWQNTEAGQWSCIFYWLLHTRVQPFLLSYK